MKTVKINQLSILRMVAGNEKRYPRVILDDSVEEWVCFGWVTVRTATDEDREKYPTAID